MGQNLGLSVEAVTQHSQRLFSKSEELDQALKDVLQKLESLMENGVTYKDKQSSKDFYEQINVFSTSCNKYVEGVQKFASFLVNETIATYETSDQEILELQSKLDESLDALELASKLGDGNITSSQLDFSKISATAGSAALGSFIAEDKVHKQYWEGELQLVPREDGTIQIVKDGTVMGYTTEEGVNFADAVTTTTPDYTDSARFNAAMSTNSSGASSTAGATDSVGDSSQDSVPTTETSTETSQEIDIPTSLKDYVAEKNGTSAGQETVEIPINLKDFATEKNGTSTSQEAVEFPTNLKDFAAENNTAGTSQSTTSNVADVSTSSNNFTSESTTTTTSQSTTSNVADVSTSSNNFTSGQSTTTTSQSTTSEPIDLPTSFNDFMNGQTGTSQTTSQQTGTEIPNIQDFIAK